MENAAVHQSSRSVPQMKGGRFTKVNPAYSKQKTRKAKRKMRRVAGVQ